MLSAIYGCPYRVKKHVSWNYFGELARTVEIPWLVVGDLDLFLSDSENKGGKSIDSNESVFFSHMTNSAGHLNLGFLGYAYNKFRVHGF